jgi:glutamate-1-semialdehyde aminotransferase
MTPSAQLPGTTSGNPPESGAGVESLLRQLAEQKQATIRAIQLTQQIEKQLAETRQELNRSLMMASIPPEPPRSAAESGGEP